MATRDEIAAAADEMRSMLDAMNENQSWQVQSENDRLLELLYLVKPLKQHLGDPVLYIPGAGAVRDWYPGVLNLTRRMQAFLKANPNWRPPDDTSAPDPAEWMHPRLWAFVEALVKLANETNDPEQLDTISRQCCVFLESEIRRRTGFTSTTHAGRPGTSRSGVHGAPHEGCLRAPERGRAIVR